VENYANQTRIDWIFRIRHENFCSIFRTLC